MRRDFAGARVGKRDKKEEGTAKERRMNGTAGAGARERTGESPKRSQRK